MAEGFSRVRERMASFLRHDEATRVLILAIIIAFFAAITGGASARPSNFTSIIVQSTQRGAAAIGVGIVIIGGGIDLSVLGNALFGGAVASRLITAGSLGQLGLGDGFFASPVPLGIGILVFLLVGIGFGAATGTIITRTGADALIPTVAMGMVGLGLAHLVIRPASNIGNLPPSLNSLAEGTTAGVPNPIILFVAVVAIAYFFMSRTTWGQRIYAVGGNPVQAWLSGIDVRHVSLMTYMISGFLAAVAGVVLLSRTMTFSLSLMADFELQALTAALIGGARLGGGKGSIIGIAIGIILLGVINNGMNLVGLHHTIQNMIRGALIVGVVGIDLWRDRRIKGGE